MAKPEFDMKDKAGARIKVVGVGGGGSNAIDSMIEKGLKGMEFYVINTDVQALQKSTTPNKIQIGEKLTHGLGTGANPEIGMEAAKESENQIKDTLTNTDMLFLTAGLGGGTGTGATPVVARIARELGVLTVAIVTRPFKFEGSQRAKKADWGLEELRKYVDTLIVISNEKLLEVVGKKATLLEAFDTSNDVLFQGVRSISDLISTPGLINVEFADICAVMGQTGGAVMGVGIGRGENRATEAVKKGCSSPLLDKIVIDGAKGVLICFTGSKDMTLNEIYEATNIVYEAADKDANIIFGAVIDESLKDEIRVTLIATGFYNAAANSASAVVAPVKNELHKPANKLPGASDSSPSSASKNPISPAQKDELTVLSPLTGVPLRSKLEKMMSEDIGMDSNRLSDAIPIDSGAASSATSSRSAETSDERAGTNGGQYGSEDSDERLRTFTDNEKEDLEIPAFLRRKIKRDRNLS